MNNKLFLIAAEKATSTTILKKAENRRTDEQKYRQTD
jgi:hypothetical protein